MFNMQVIDDVEHTQTVHLHANSDEIHGVFEEMYTVFLTS